MIQRNLDEYIAGFVDGEGCFASTLRRDVRKERSGSPVYFHWKAMFAIELRADDREILELIKSRFNYGSVTDIPKRNVVRYQITKISELNNIVTPFFEVHPLIGKKNRDFIAWRKAVEILFGQKEGSGGNAAANRNMLKKLHEEMQKIKGPSSRKRLWIDVV